MYCTTDNKNAGEGMKTIRYSMLAAVILEIALVVILLSAFGRLSFGQPFTFKVRHDHWRGGCTGRLTIDDQGIEYRTEDGGHSRKWSYPDLKRIDIQSGKSLELLTYEDRKLIPGAERKFEFELLEGEITEAVYRLLLDKSPRPLLARLPYGSTAPVFSLGAKHRHRVGGCEGELQFERERVIYRTDKPGDTRIWLYADISSVGLLDRYSLRLTTLLETYTFDLKLPITSEQYNFLWAKVYHLEDPYPASARASRLASKHV